eukprot:TRINITY_DN196_c0_g1_i1.p1 TRINITY_DN196_c0_g1~~TRINITY_DN196_c0_g1_i1.p1  ORF type:complete len:310 (+),score=86.10 TRINITY_DN196_c0_g1_i1:341-1270(+)
MSLMSYVFPKENGTTTLRQSPRGCLAQASEESLSDCSATAVVDHFTLEHGATSSQQLLKRAMMRRSERKTPAALLLCGAALAWLQGSEHSFAFWRAPAASQPSQADAGLADAESNEGSLVQMNRRTAFGGLGAAVVAAPVLPALAYESFTDASKGYAFKYPTGLEKFDRKGYATFLRDLIEPLEYIGVEVTDTKRKTVEEIGTDEEIAQKMLKELVPDKAPQELIKTSSKTDSSGRKFIIIEYRFQWKFDPDLATQLGRRTYQLHCKALLAVNKRKQYILSTGAEEARWEVHGEGGLDAAIQTFQLLID